MEINIILVFSSIYLIISSYNCLDFFCFSPFQNIFPVVLCSFERRFFSDFLSCQLIRYYNNYRTLLHSSLQWCVHPFPSKLHIQFHYIILILLENAKNNGKSTWCKKVQCKRTKNVMKHFFNSVPQKHATKSPWRANDFLNLSSAAVKCLLCYFACIP